MMPLFHLEGLTFELHSWCSTRLPMFLLCQHVPWPAESRLKICQCSSQCQAKDQHCRVRRIAGSVAW